RSIAAVLPGDLPVPLALAVLDVCGAPALTARVVSRYAALPGTPWPADPLDSANRPPAAPRPGVPPAAPGPGLPPGGSGAGGPRAVSGVGAPPAAQDASVSPAGPSAAVQQGAPGAGGPRGGSGVGGPQRTAPAVAVIGGGGKSGSLALAAARRAGAGRCVGV